MFKSSVHAGPGEAGFPVEARWRKFDYTTHSYGPLYGPWKPWGKPFRREVDRDAALEYLSKFANVFEVRAVEIKEEEESNERA